MDVHAVAQALMEKADELRRGVNVTWRYPKRTPTNPLKATPRSSWASWKPGEPLPLEKHADNWFYGEFVFPRTRTGIRLEGTEGWIFMHGWCPFTLWLDGEEIFKETHAWHATGPIADPIIRKIEPGRKYRLIMCLRPTELPAGFNPLAVSVQMKACVDAAAELTAAAFQLRYADALARGAKERNAVNEAAALVDLDAVQHNRWSRAARSIAAMEESLEWLRDRARKLTMHIIGHTHIDMDWMWTWPDTVHCIRRDFKAVTQLQDDYPDLTFIHSQVPTYQVAMEHDPDVFAKVKQRIAEGRWENAAGTWVEGDLNMADGESIARHMLYAADWTLRHLGTKAKVMWEPDTFGHPGNIPQLAVLGEHDCYFHWRANPGVRNNWPIRTWKGVDGTPITTFSTAYGSGLLPEHILGNVLDAHKFGLKNGLHIWGMGDHGGGLPRYYIDVLNNYRDKPVMPTFTFSTIARLLQAVKEEGARLPTNTGQTFNLFEGCFTTHASIKKYNRLCETALLTAEAMSALAGLNKTDVLRDAWTKMLFNHFHDIFDGAAVHDSYINAHERAEASIASAEKVTREAVRVLAKPARSGNTLVVLNPLGFERTEPVTVDLPRKVVCLVDDEGRAVPIQRKGDKAVFIARNVPAFGAKNYTLVYEAPYDLDTSEVQVADEAGYFKIETPVASAWLSKESGTIGSYYCKALKREMVGYGVPKHLTHVPSTRCELALNVFQLIDEAPNAMPAWLINDHLKQENLLRSAKVELVETGPVFARFRVGHKFRSSGIEEAVIFYKKFPRVDFEATIDWREKGGPDVGVPELKVSFAASMSAARARFEGPFYVQEWPADGQEYPTQKWADVSGREFGFTLLNDSKYGADALGSRLRITLLRNPYGPDPETDNGVHTVRFAFQPHGARKQNAELIREGMAYNRPLLAVRTNEEVPSGPRLTIEGGDSVVCSALRHAEHSDDLIIRFFETGGKKCSASISLAGGIEAAEEVNFLENPTGGKVKVSGGKAAVNFRPCEVKSLRVRCR